jgi:hypothetical protein
MAGVALQLVAPLDLGHHGSVEAEPGVEQEAPPVDAADADPPIGVAMERGEQLAGGLQRIPGDPDGPGEHVGRAARERRQGGGRARQAVGRLIQRPVAAHGHHHVDAVVGRAVGQPFGVAAPGRLGHGELVVGGQRLGDDDPGPGGHRRRGGIDDEEDPHRRGD